MPELTWVPDPLNPDPRVGWFRLSDHLQTYWLSMGDGTVNTRANPSRAPHTFSDYGLFRAIARVRSGGEVLDSITINIPDPDQPAPQVSIVQRPGRSFLYRPPYYLGNLDLEVANTSRTFLERYTVDWGGPQGAPEPNRSTRYLTPGQVVHGNQPEGSYTATVTNEATGKKAQVEYQVTPEAEASFAPDGAQGMRVRATVTSLVDLRPDEDPGLASVDIDWGDGTGESLPFEVGAQAWHTYSAHGSYTALLCPVYDGSGPCYEHTITVPLQDEQE